MTSKTNKTKQRQLAELLLSMTYVEIMDFARDIEQMQQNALEETDFQWEPAKADSEYGFAAMMMSWAEGQ